MSDFLPEFILGRSLTVILNVPTISDKMDKEIVITVIMLSVFSIVLPVADIFSDVSFISVLYNAGHLRWASTSLGILVVHTLFIASVWVRYEPRGEKAYSWVFVILNLWMPYKALFKYCLLYTSPSPRDS